MEFEWDEEKRRSNIEKHGIDFIDAGELFDGPYLNSPARVANDEPRWLATGRVGEFYITAIYTLRGKVIRIISMRSARHAEKDHHQKTFNG